jgi:membrane protease YdiL (CAAX protease family)
MLAVSIVIVGALMIAIQIGQDRIQYPRFKGMSSTLERQSMYRYWTFDSFVRYGALGVAGLFLLHRQNAIIGMPGDFLSAWREEAARIGLPPTRFEALGTGLAWGLLIGTVIMSIVPFVLRKTGRRSPVLTGDIAALIPRTAGEIRWGAALSMNAGISEEIFFRLLMPLAWFALTGNASAALMISAVLFGLVHAYQGIVGVLATMAVGALLTFVYLASQQIWLAILLHALIDLRALVAMPLARIGAAHGQRKI